MKQYAGCSQREGFCQQAEYSLGGMPGQSAGLVERLGSGFGNELPSYGDFTAGFRDMYAHHYVASALDQYRERLHKPEAAAIDGIAGQFAAAAGYTTRQVSRLRAGSQYIDSLLSSVSVSSTSKFEEVERSSPFVSRMIEYQSDVEQYAENDPFQARMKSLLPNRPEAEQIMHLDL